MDSLPEKVLPIAQHFSAGSISNQDSPGGTAESVCRITRTLSWFSRPSGTYGFSPSPSTEVLGYSQNSLREKTRDAERVMSGTR